MVRLLSFLLLSFSTFAGELMFFYHPLCKYCKLQMEELERNKDCLRLHSFYAIDVAQEREYARLWGVYMVPVLVLRERGQLYRVDGVIVGEDLRRFLFCHAGG